MENKIENLIKEVGIDEVEAVLNQMKSKVNIKENIKKDFIKLLSGCTISFLSDAIEYRKDGSLLFYYQKNYNIFRIKYDIWLDFAIRYSLNNQELGELFAGIVEDVLNYKNITPKPDSFY